MSCWKVAPALAAGCAVVLKPSEHASVTSLELGSAAAAAGLPAGALNVVTGLGAGAGAPLSSDARLAKLAFTGSTATGRRVYASAAQNLRPAGMELGGKSCAIVFEDADVDKAVEWIAFGVFANGGQICSSTSRVLVQKSVRDRFLARLAARARAIVPADPTRPGTRLGPVVNREQHEKVLGHIAKARAEGLVPLVGGGRPEGLPKGFFVAPTVFADVTPAHSLWREEVFGPVLAVAAFADEREAVELANDSEYGLGSAVFSADLARARRVQEALEVGICWINCSQPTFVQAPWGGVKNSGFGRELGPFGMDNFIAVKQVTTYESEDRWDWYPDLDAQAKL